MPKGPKGEKRPADVIGAAVKVMKIATGEVEEDTDDGKDKAAVELGRKWRRGFAGVVVVLGAGRRRHVLI